MAREFERESYDFFALDLARNNICLQMLLKTRGNEKLIGTGSAGSKSMQTLSEKSSPKIFISFISEHPSFNLLAVATIGSFSTLIFTNSAQTVSQAIGSVPPISQPSGESNPRRLVKGNLLITTARKETT